MNIRSIAGERATKLQLCLFGRDICGLRLRLPLVGAARVVGTTAASPLAGTGLTRHHVVGHFLSFLADQIVSGG